MAKSESLPDHKMIPSTGFIVDGFKYQSPQIEAYFLSHAHGDHYGGLRETWDYGPIYCSKVTAKLIVCLLGVKEELIHPLDWDTPTMIAGVEVTLTDANHCPGAAQILFRLPRGQTYIHCGDMRFSPHLLENPHLARFQGCDAVFLDTTYCHQKYTFPPQEESVEYVAATIHRLMQEQGIRRLYLIQTYVIGKEHILIEVHRRCGCKIFVSERKLAVMKCLDMPGLTEDMFTTNPDTTSVHLTQWGWLGESFPFFKPNFKNMEKARREMGCDEVVGFCPTGWMYEMKQKAYPVRTKGSASIHLVPYSEHSSYRELQEYVRFLRPHKVIPTVGVEGQDGERKRRSILKHFRNLVNETASKAKFLASFQRSGSLPSASVQPDDSLATKRVDNAAGDVPVEQSEHGQARDEQGMDADLLDAEMDLGKDSDGEETGLAGAQLVKAEPSELEEAADPAAEEDTAESCIGAGLPGAPSEEGIVKEEIIIKEEPRSTAAGARCEGEAKGMVQLPASDPDSKGYSGILEADMLRERLESSKGASTSGSADELLVDQVLAVLGGDVSRSRAQQLLERSKGDMMRAINSHYDGGGPPAMATSTAPKGIKKEPDALAQSPASAKRKRGSRGAPQGAKHPKLAPAQRQITSFFGGNKAGAPAQMEDGRDAEPIVLDDDGEQVPESHSSPPAFQPGSRAPLPSIKKEDSPSARGKVILPPAPIFMRKATSGRDGAAFVKSEGDTQAAPTSGPVKAAATSTERALEAGDIQEAQAVLESKDISLDGPTAGAKREPARDRSREVAADVVLKALNDYDPVGMAIWERGQAAPYLHVARALAAMDGTTKRLRISDVIANMFRSLFVLSPEDVLPAAYLVTGKLAPDYESLEMSVGGSTVAAALMDCTGVTRARLSQLYRQLGDMGDVAQACRQNQSTLQKPVPLTVRGVYKTLKGIALTKGSGSAKRKQGAVMSLLRSAREEEPRYVVRTLVSNLRVGANWRSVIPGLARAALLHQKGNKVNKADLAAASAAAVEAFHLCPNLDVLVPALLGGVDELQRRCTLTAGVPLLPMLAKICEGIPDALRQLKGPFLAEFKYDGQRSQIHLLRNGSVKLFSRNGEDKTMAFPDVVEIVQQAAEGGAKELVMDAELVAVDRADNNRLRAFQELATRARGQVTVAEVNVHVCVFLFDLLMVDGEVLLKQTLRERRERIAQALPKLRTGYIQIAQSREFAAPDAVEGGAAQQPEAPDASRLPATTNKEAEAEDEEEALQSDSEAQIHTYLLEAFASGTEGLMLKALVNNATYQASKRSESWLKLKKDYCEGLRDSLDLVPIGAWHGQGRKTGWMSPFLLAAWDPEREEFQSVCRCMSGFTDAFYAEATARMSERKCERKSYYSTGESCSIWFEPEEVWELRGAELTISPVHKAAIGLIDANRERGLSLRFPRFIRIREKRPEEATSPEEIADLYNKQSRKMHSAAALLAAQKDDGGQKDEGGQKVAGDVGSDRDSQADEDADAAEPELDM